MSVVSPPLKEAPLWIPTPDQFNARAGHAVVTHGAGRCAVGARGSAEPKSAAAGKAFLDMLGVFAEFETNLRKERQLEGIAKAKAAGVYKGRKPTVDVVRVRALQQQGIGPSAIAKTLGIGRASVYRALCEQTTADRSESDANVAR